jgi:putative SOS response-associated peptidase YedK
VISTHVPTHAEEKLLTFNPQTGHDMLLACLCDRLAPGEPLLESFTAITDEPPVQIAAAGHDRCVIPLTDANLDHWLNPAGRATSELSRMLDECSSPYYKHELAA